jgi:uncharacterized protein YfbU (UPF0304 family)
MNMAILTPYERAVLANQYRILECLVPNEAKRYRRAREALECGYEANYDLVGIYPEETDPPLTRAQCEEVNRVFDMYRSLYASYEQLDDKTGIDPCGLQLQGWDNHAEIRQSSYACWISGGASFPELQNREFISTRPMLDRYRRMLAVWKECRRLDPLTKDEILRIVQA